MKKMFAMSMLVAGLAGGSAWATSLRPTADMVARMDPAVQAAINAVTAEDFMEEDRVVDVVLSSHCGFVGCASEHLVVFTFSSRRSNRMAASVTAKVEYDAFGRWEVSLIELLPAKR